MNKKIIILVVVLLIISVVAPNEISDRLLALEEKRTVPYLEVDVEKSKVAKINNKEIDISIFLKNTTEVVVNIQKVSDLMIFSLGRERLSINFDMDWTKDYSVFPKQSRKMNFYKEIKISNEQLIEINEFCVEDEFLILECRLILKLGYVNSDDKYNQTFNFALMIPKDTKMSLSFSDIENSIVKDDE